MTRNSISSDGEDRSYSPNPYQGNYGRGYQARQQGQSPNPSLGPGNGHSNGHQQSPNVFNRPPVNIKNNPHRQGSTVYRVPTPQEMGDPEMDFMQPNFNPDTDRFTELLVSNLDYNIDPRDWSKIIYATFHPHVKILNIQTRLQGDNSSIVTVRVPSEQDARFAINTFNRRKIGYKRINVQNKNEVTVNPFDQLRLELVTLLVDMPENRIALSRLIEVFDSRFHKSVAVSDLYKLRDTIRIEDQGAGRYVKLQQAAIPMTPEEAELEANKELPEGTPMPREAPVCSIHCPPGTLQHSQASSTTMLPYVKVKRKNFAPELHSLLLSHNGYIPLMSFLVCYNAEFSSLPVAKEGGVALEHVISCVPGVDICTTKSGVKVIQFQENREQFENLQKNNTWQELGKISREIMELLRLQVNCTISVAKFIPAFHQYYNRQCRVADYGYAKLHELFDAIPHAIQIIGSGDRKAITLSNRAQLKRFTTDIIKVVKAQPAKQIMLEEFPLAYKRVLGKDLNLPHYGVAFVEDVLTDIPTTTLIVIEEGNHTLLAIPRRDQTPEEVERTKQFCLEVIDLLRQRDKCRMGFNKFIPSYHHHFGRQCRVADYGFTKLTDLFEAISYSVQILESDDKQIQLTRPEVRKVLCQQLATLILDRDGPTPLESISLQYLKHYGYSIKPEVFYCSNVRELIIKLRNNFTIEMVDRKEVVTIVNSFIITQPVLRVMQILMDESGGSMPLMELASRYEGLHTEPLDTYSLMEDMHDYVQVDDSDEEGGGVIRLTAHQMLARNLRLVLLRADSIVMADLVQVYRDTYGVELSPQLYGFQSLYLLLQSLPHILELRGRSGQKYLVLSGTMPTPVLLPPARVNVSPTMQHQASPPPQVQGAHGGVNNGDPTPSDSLLLAAQCLDNDMAQQLSDLSMGASGDQGVPVSPAGIPVAWQMKAGEGQSPDQVLNEVLFGKKGQVSSHTPKVDAEAETMGAGGDCSIEKSKEGKDKAQSPNKKQTPANFESSPISCRPQSSNNSSPVKRPKSRIAANFSKAL